MIKIIYSLVFFIVVIFPFLTLAHSDLSLNEILTEIIKSQGVNEKSQIECAKVTDEQFEKLGEAVMSLMHPDEKEHQLMDQMMGGEGSQSLKAMHILMGKRYLGCVSAMMIGRGAIMEMPMMQMMMGGWSSPSGFNKTNNPMMMEWFQNSIWWGGGGSWLIILTWIIWLVVGILAAIWLWKQITKKD